MIFTTAQLSIVIVIGQKLRVLAFSYIVCLDYHFVKSHSTLGSIVSGNVYEFLTFFFFHFDFSS